MLLLVNGNVYIMRKDHKHYMKSDEGEVKTKKKEIIRK